MWPQTSRDRAGRVIAAIDQATSIASSGLVLAPVAVALIATVSGFALGPPWIGAFAGGALAMVLLVVLLLLFPLHGAMRCLFYGFRFRSVQITMEIDAHGDRQHRRFSSFATRIVRTGIRRIPDRYCAPGPAESEATSARHAPKVVSDNAQVLDILYDQNDECWIYQMDLGAPLSAGTDCDVDVEQNLDFSAVGYEPRLQRTILDPTDQLVLCLRVPEHCWPLHAVGEEILPGDRRKSIAVIKDDAHREVRLEKQRPRFGSVYRIRWNPLHETWRIRITRSEVVRTTSDAITAIT
jgi:hypothetical protein